MKTPQQQIADARQALNRAYQRQRATDTRSKIVIGGLILAWARESAQMRQGLLQRLTQRPLREQDRQALAAVIEELQALQQATPQQPTQPQ